MGHQVLHLISDHILENNIDRCYVGIYFCLYNLYPETFFELNGFTLMGLLLYGTHNKIFEVLYVLKLRSIFFTGKWLSW